LVKNGLLVNNGLMVKNGFLVNNPAAPTTSPVQTAERSPLHPEVVAVSEWLGAA
jgi:hypothetical protein